MIETFALLYLVVARALSSFSVWVLAFVTAYCSLRFRRDAGWVAAGTAIALVILAVENDFRLSHGADAIAIELLFGFFWALVFVSLVLAFRAAWHNFLKLDLVNGPHAANQ